MILYLHGFRSSPQSFKARLLGEHLAAVGRSDAYACPQLPPEPAAAIDMALGLARSVPPNKLCLIGSSLGGYYATWMAEQLGCRAILLNPALRAFEKLSAHVGPQEAFHDGGEAFEFKPAYLEQLRALHIPAITRPERYFLIAAKGDELLDWREMVAAFPHARHKVLEGSDHGLSDFADYIHEVLTFAEK